MDPGTLVESFLVGLATATAAAIVAGVVALIRFIQRTDKYRMDLLEDSSELARKVEHRQNHVLRWIRAAGRKIGLPFPLNGDNDLDPYDEEDL